MVCLMKVFVLLCAFPVDAVVDAALRERLFAMPDQQLAALANGDDVPPAVGPLPKALQSLSASHASLAAWVPILYLLALCLSGRIGVTLPVFHEAVEAGMSIQMWMVDQTVAAALLGCRVQSLKYELPWNFVQLAGKLSTACHCLAGPAGSYMAVITMESHESLFDEHRVGIALRGAIDELRIEFAPTDDAIATAARGVLRLKIASEAAADEIDRRADDRNEQERNAMKRRKIEK